MTSKPSFHVTAVLNASGTLFRTKRAERISTVRYRDIDGDKIESIADYSIEADRLVEEGILRPPDVFRVGATVELVDLTTAEITVSAIVDLDKEAEARAWLRKQNDQSQWQEQIVHCVLDELERRHRDSGGQPVKALIVAHRQDAARDYCDEVNRQMGQRGLVRLAECVVSDDGPDGLKRLETFRTSQNVGVLCTVGMAGEGYDCPDLIVIAYVTNVLTQLYVKQVTARGQRVTSWERARGRPLTTAIIAPDNKQIVELLRQVLAPMVHTIDVPTDAATLARERGNGAGGAIRLDRYDVVDVRETSLDFVTPVSKDSGDVPAFILDILGPALRDQNLPESDAARVHLAYQRAAQTRPFDMPTLFDDASPRTRPAQERRPMTAREHNEVVRPQVHALIRWWAKCGDTPVDHFVVEIKQQSGIPSGKAGFDRASGPQLEQAWRLMSERIRWRCQQSGDPLPRDLREENGS